MSDYTTSMAACGVALRRARPRPGGAAVAAAVAARGHRGRAPAAGGDRAGRAWHPGHAGRRPRPRRRAARPSPGERGPRPRRRRSRGRGGRRHVPLPPAGRVRRRLDQPGAGRHRPPGAADGDAGAGDVLPARAARAVRARSCSRCGCGWTTRASTASRATARTPSRRRRTAAVPRSMADERSVRARPARCSGVLADFMARTLPGSGPPVRSVRCLYTLVPDRDFVLGPVPGHEAVVVGMGAAHGFKFAPTFGRLLAELAVDRRAATPT